MNTRRNCLIAALFVLTGGLAACSQNRSSLHYFLRGTLEAKKGHVQQAIGELSQAIARNPDLVLAYAARGQLYKTRKEYELAAADFKRACQLEPFDFDNHYQLGLMYQYLHDFPKAVAAYQNAVEIRPYDTNANTNLAVVYAESGEPFTALNYAQRAVKGNPKSAPAHANLGAIYAQVADINPHYLHLAIDELKESVELDPHQPAIYLDLAAEYLKLHQFEQARETLVTAEGLGPSPLVSERLGYCYYKLGNMPRAMRAYRNSLKQNPSYTEARNGLGVVFMTQALRSNPPAVALAQGALKQWRESLRINANQPVIRELLNEYSPKQ